MLYLLLRRHIRGAGRLVRSPLKRTYRLPGKTSKDKRIFNFFSIVVIYVNVIQVFETPNLLATVKKFIIK